MAVTATALNLIIADCTIVRVVSLNWDHYSEWLSLDLALLGYVGSRLESNNHPNFLRHRRDRYEAFIDVVLQALITLSLRHQ